MNNSTGEVKEVTILEMAQGAIEEQLAHETKNILKNILDPNTDHKSKRSITVTLEFRANEARDSVQVLGSCKSKPAPIKPVETTLFIADGEEGPTAVEYTKGHIEGQEGFANTVPQNNIIKLA